MLALHSLAVYVSGAPGAGKTSVAVPLAHRLGLPLLAKDVIKEQLFDSLAPSSPDPTEWSRALGGAAMDLLWTLAALARQAVLEANFRPHSQRERAALLALGRPLVEVYCECPPAMAAERYARRSSTAGRHQGAHPLRALTPEQLAEFDGPVGLGGLVRVDTTRPVDIEVVADSVERLLGAGG